jgi:hypothetical protein
MKRAACFELAAGFLELNSAAEHFDDIGSRDKLIDEMLWYQSAHSFKNLSLPLD